MLVLWIGLAAAVELQLPAMDAEKIVLDDGVVTVAHGVLENEQGRLSFVQGHVVLDTRHLALEDVEVRLESGWIIRAELLTGVLDEDAWLTNASLTACDCDCPVWELKAERLFVPDLEVAQLEELSFDFLGKIRIPLPNSRIPLERSTVGLGLPNLGLELSGPRVELPLVLRLSPQTDVEFRPGWWRGPRLGGEFQSPDTRADWTIEWADQFAALAAVQHQQSSGSWGSAVDGLWADSLESLGRSPTYLVRQQSYTEQLGRLWVGPAVVEGWAWQGEQEAAFWQIGLRNTHWSLGPISGDHSVGFGLYKGQQRAQLSASLQAVEHWGPLEVHLRGESRALDYGFSEQAVDWRANLDASMVAWGRHGDWLHELRVGVKALQSERVWDELVPLGAMDSPWWRGGIGPRVRSQWWGGDAGHARLDAWARMDAAGLRGWSASGKYRADAWGLQAQSHSEAGESLHGLRLSHDSERTQFWLGALAQEGESLDVFSQGMIEAGARIGVPLGESMLWPSASALVVPEGIAALNAGVSVESNCDCFLVGLDVGWFEDRDTVTVGLALDLLPDPRSSSKKP